MEKPTAQKCGEDVEVIQRAGDQWPVAPRSGERGDD